MPVLAQQKTVKKRVTFQLIKKRGADAAVAGKRKAAASAQAVTNINNSVLLAYYPAAGSGVEGYENYYLVLSDKEDVSYDANDGQIKATSATVAELDLYAPEGTGIELPAGPFAASEGNLYYDPELTYVENFDDKGNSDGGVNITSDINVSKAENDGTVTYTLSFSDDKGTQYSYVGEMQFNNMSAGSSDVYPQISTDINTTFHGGIGYYYGNLMDSKTGNMVLNLYDGEYDTETGGMTGKGHDLVINLYNRLFGDPKTATVVPGTYTVARNFKVGTFFPGMEIDYNGMTVVMGTYVKRRKAVTGMDTDYDYCYITNGTITIADGEKEGTYDITVDCTTDRGHKVTGTAKGISFIYYDKSE